MESFGPNLQNPPKYYVDSKCWFFEIFNLAEKYVVKIGPDAM